MNYEGFETAALATIGAAEGVYVYFIKPIIKDLGNFALKWYDSGDRGPNAR